MSQSSVPVATGDADAEVRRKLLHAAGKLQQAGTGNGAGKAAEAAPRTSAGQATGETDTGHLAHGAVAVPGALPPQAALGLPDHYSVEGVGAYTAALVHEAALALGLAGRPDARLLVLGGGQTDADFALQLAHAARLTHPVLMVDATAADSGHAATPAAPGPGPAPAGPCLVLRRCTFGEFLREDGAGPFDACLIKEGLAAVRRAELGPLLSGVCARLTTLGRVLLVARPAGPTALPLFAAAREALASAAQDPAALTEALQAAGFRVAVARPRTFRLSWPAEAYVSAVAEGSLPGVAGPFAEHLTQDVVVAGVNELRHTMAEAAVAAALGAGVGSPVHAGVVDLSHTATAGAAVAAAGGAGTGTPAAKRAASLTAGAAQLSVEDTLLLVAGGKETLTV